MTHLFQCHIEARHLASHYIKEKKKLYLHVYQETSLLNRKKKKWKINIKHKNKTTTNKQSSSESFG